MNEVSITEYVLKFNGYKSKKYENIMKNTGIYSEFYTKTNH